MSNRSISSSIWHHPFFRKHPWFVREIFIYIFSSAADDEGRFLADSENILEDCFPRSYPVTVEDVQLALETLHEGGLLFLYGDHKQYGFCTGWYEHQKLDKRYRDESSYPAPPVLISSWQQADSIKEKYIKERNMAGCNVRYDDAIRWYTALSNERVTEDSRETRELLAGDSRETRAQPNLTQPNLTDNDSLSPSEHPDADAEDLQLQTDPKKKPAKRVKPPIDETFEAIEALRLEYSQEDLQQVDDFIGMVREHRKGGRLAASVIKKMIEGLLKLRREPGMTSDAFAYGITQAINKSADNVSYAAKAAWNYSPQQALQGNRTPPQKLGGFGIPTSMEEMLKQVGKQKL